jgi:hypothetical protein
LSAELERNPLWLILVEAVHGLPMYGAHKAYVRDRILLQISDITPEEVSTRLDIPLGEAMVILHELLDEGSSENMESAPVDASES